jgi:hypothetical protein
MNTQATQNENGMTAKEASDYSRMVAVEWGEDNADLLTCFHGETLNQGLFGLFATTHHATQPIYYGELSLGFLRLLDSKVLIPEFPIQGVADEQLQAMRDRFTPASEPTPSAQASATDPNNFSKMTLAAFDAISTQDSRRLYKSNPSFRKRADYLWQTGGNR